MQYFIFSSSYFIYFTGIDDTLYDHTSVLKYVLQKWAPEGVNQLGERVKHANTLPILKVPRSTEEFPPYPNKKKKTKTKKTKKKKW
jgi:hypothetical protein